MTDLETRQLVWDRALITGWHKKERLLDTFAHFAEGLKIPPDVNALCDALAGLRHLPPAREVLLMMRADGFMARYFPGVNRQMWDTLSKVSDKKNTPKLVERFVAAFNRVERDTPEKPCVTTKPYNAHDLNNGSNPKTDYILAGLLKHEKSQKPAEPSV